MGSKGKKEVRLLPDHGRKQANTCKASFTLKANATRMIVTVDLTNFKLKTTRMLTFTGCSV